MADKQNEFEPLAQMTFKKMGLDARQAIKTEKNWYMCRVFGEAGEMKTKESRNGDPYHYLIGEFRAITPQGKQYESSKLFLPGSIMEQVEASLKTSDGKPVQFAFDVYAQPDDTVTIGYKYAVKKLLAVEASDRLTEITKGLGSKPLPQNDSKKEK